MSKLIAEYLYNNVSEADYNYYYQYLASSYIDTVKHIILTELTDIERRVILLYADLGNMRSVADILKISLGKTHNVVHTIQDKIKTKLKEDDI